MLPLILGAAGAALGGLLGYQGQRDTNDTNARIASETSAANFRDAQNNRDFQAQQSSAQMAFQERMANTAHQREMADLKAAGINPIMAANKGADTPSGASGGGAQGSAVSAQMQNPNVHLQSMLGSALETMSMAQGIDKQKAETEYIRTQSHVAKKGIPRAELSNDIYDLFKPYIKKAKDAISSQAKELEWQMKRPLPKLNNRNP